MATKTNLTPRQERFAEEFLVDFNATQAAIRSGYSSKGAKVQGHRLLTNDNVMKVIQAGREKLSKKVEKESGINANWVLTEQRKVYDRCMTDADFKQAAGANKALETIGKHKAVDAFNKDEDEGRDKAQELTIVVVSPQPR